MSKILDTSPTEIADFILYNVKQYTKLHQLSEAQTEYVLELFHSMDPNMFKTYKLQQIGPALGKVLGTKLLEFVNLEKEQAKNLGDSAREYQVAMLGSAEQAEHSSHALLEQKTELPKVSTISINDFLGINNMTDFKLMFNPSSMLVHYYLVLDSDYRNTTDEDPLHIKKFTWYYTATQNILQRGFCNSQNVIRDVIGIRLYQPRIPYVAAINSSAKRVSLLIDEFKAQSFICDNGNRFHFLLRPDLQNADTSIELTSEDYNDAVFNFRIPFVTFDTMTVIFGNPTEVIEFSEPFDRFVIAMEFICYKSDK